MGHRAEVQQQTTVSHVLALPYPARGHINPMMCLCNTLTSKNPDTLITFVITEEWLGLIGAQPKPSKVRFATIPNVLPSEVARAGTYKPIIFEEVATKMGDPVERLVDRLEPPVSIIISDANLIWAVDIGNRRHIPVASLWTMSASVYSVFHHFDLLVQNRHFPVALKEQRDELVDYIPGVSPTRIGDLPGCVSETGLELLHRAVETIAMVSKAQYLLLYSVYELEANSVDILKEKISAPVYHVGPLIPYFKLLDNSSVSPTDTSYIQWLDMQPKGSVLYVSQGSLYTVSKSQLEEIAAGLRTSGARYFWAARKEASLFKESCSDKGLIVPWCDQLRVLCHPSIGGFWSHCGWNSTSEAVYAGVPILTNPIYWDQLHNAKLIVEDWKIGWRVKSTEMDEERIVTREEIADLVRRFMDLETDEGKEMRRRVSELRDITHRAIQRGGSSYTDLDAFVGDMSECQKS